VPSSCHSRAHYVLASLEGPSSREARRRVHRRSHIARRSGLRSAENRVPVPLYLPRAEGAPGQSDGSEPLAPAAGTCCKAVSGGRRSLLPSEKEHPMDPTNQNSQAPDQSNAQSREEAMWQSANHYILSMPRPGGKERHCKDAQ
jgi:hypothetical protein